MVRFTGLLAMFPSSDIPFPPGPDFTYTNFSGGRGFAFYLHKLFGGPDFEFYKHKLFGWPGFAFYLHTLSGAFVRTEALRFLSKLDKIDLKLEKVSALRAPFFLSNP